MNQFKSCVVGGLLTVNEADLFIEFDDLPECKGKRPDFFIKDKVSLQDGKNGYVLLILDHIGSDLERLLVCSYYEGGKETVMDVKLYARPDFFTPDRRCELEKSDNGWIFDGEGFAQEIYSGEGEEKITYKKKFQNESFGDSCIAEWVTESEILNYELFVFEKGSTNQFGGWVEFYEGRTINALDVVFQA
jgi:hypothetical protein